ncbi:MAG: BamA/TamA family outer membrane protein [Puniceicoccales bacterium]|jgi:outer membrane protein assembly factor BamA|nr:BamA/TamA family outer membrane protein [Puniceicoccales bacterium]
MTHNLLKPGLFAFLTACAAGISICAHAQENPRPPAPSAPLYREPLVSTIEYRFEGQRPMNADEAAAQMRLKPGLPFTQEASDASVRALYATGFYEYVSIDPDPPAADGTVRVRVTLGPRMRVERVSFQGNTYWDTESTFGTALIDESLIREGDPLNEVLIARTCEKLRKKYDGSGFPFAEITPKIDRNEENGTATVTFVIKENYDVTISSVTFSGNTHIREADLRPQIETSSWALLFDPADFPGNRFLKISPIRQLGYYHSEEFRTDIEKLRAFYRNQGFLDIEIPEETIERDIIETGGQDARISLKIKVSEGRRYKVGKLSIEGNILGSKKPHETDETVNASPDRLHEINVFNTKTILVNLARRRRDITRPYPFGSRVIDSVFADGVKADDVSEVRTNFDSIESGDWYSPTAIENAIQKIRDHYGQYGYLNTFVTVRRRPNVETGEVDLVFYVTEGVKTYLGTINIIGNTKTRNRVITRELIMAPGEVFDTVRMRNSETILRNTRFFKSVILQPEISNVNVPNRRDLRIEVAEESTGSLNFGGGFSSIEKLYAFAEYSESNFDIFNYRNYFRGGGQKFRFRVQIGTHSNLVLQSFEIPWFGERELSVGYEAYLRNESFSSSDYETQRLGLNIHAQRRIYENINAQLGYTIEEIKTRNIAYSAPSFVRAEEGAKVASKVGLTFYRDTRNDAFFPTYGNRFSLFNTVAGGPLGGDINYYSIDAHAAQWIPIFDAAEQTLLLRARAGSMIHYGSGYIPFYERFKLGGAYNLRGFKYDHVGPFDGDEPTGGNTYAFFSAEYTVKLFDELRVAFFYDWGFLNSGSFNFEAANYNDNAGFGFRIKVMAAIMRIDIGWPLTTSKHYDNNDGVRFNFSFGAVF